MNILFVNACVRGEESNTLKLCRAALEELEKAHPKAVITEVNLNAQRPQPLHPETMTERSRLRSAGDFSHPMFDYAKQFAGADRIVIGAPYWDLSFPAVLKIYLELICAVDIAFAYSEEGAPYGLCAADQLLYITTAGGPVGEYNLGFEYIKGLCEVFFGIPNVSCFAVKGLDMCADMDEAIQKGERELRDSLRA